MKILFLSPHIHLIEYLMSYGDEITQTIEPLTDKLLEDKDFIISYGYRHIIEKPVLDRFKDRAINLHISYLPWNRGADPILWAILEGTPLGVSMHFINEKLDKGDLIAQRYYKYDINDTFTTLRSGIDDCMEDMFKKVWPYIRKGKAKRYQQTTYHNSRDKEKYQHLLTKGWDTPIRDLIGKATKEI